MSYVHLYPNIYIHPYWYVHMRAQMIEGRIYKTIGSEDHPIWDLWFHEHSELEGEMRFSSIWLICISSLHWLWNYHISSCPVLIPAKDVVSAFSIQDVTVNSYKQRHIFINHLQNKDLSCPCSLVHQDTCPQDLVSARRPILVCGWKGSENRAGRS